MAAPNAVAPPLPTLLTTEPSSSRAGIQGQKKLYGDFCAIHSIGLGKEGTQAPENPSASVPATAPIPRGLPLCFIDEQELRQPSNTKLRRVIRSHARRDTDLKRKQLNAALKSNLETPRPIVGRTTQPRQDAGRPKLLTARVESFGSRRAVHYGTVISFSEIALGTLTSQSAPGTPSGENKAINRYNELNERLRSGKLPSWQNQPITGSHKLDEENCIAPFGYQFSGDGNAVILETISLGCPTCREIAIFDHDMHATQLLRRTTSDPQVLNIANTLLGNSWRQDPFDSHSLLNNPRTSFLLSYCTLQTYESHKAWLILLAYLDNEVVNTVWVCKKSLWSFQTSTPALLHATMLYTASHLRFLSHNIEYDRDIFHHRGETMRIINTSLDDPCERTSDQIIGALSSLILFEETYGSNQTAALHRCGLKQLLQLRYAKSGIEIHRLVQHLLVHPQVDPDEPEISVDSTPETGHAGRLTDLSRSLAKNLVQGTILGHGVTSVYVWLTNTAQRAGNPLQDQEGYLTLRNNIEIYLASFPSPEFPASSSSDRAWLIASMIYLHTILITPAEASPLPTSEEELVMVLKRTMEKLLSNPNGFSYPCSMRLWVMMMGGLYSRFDDLDLLKDADGRSASNCKEWSDEKVLLRDVKWIERGAEEKLREMRFTKEDEEVWNHLQGFYGDEVYKWKV
ncbi:hypothetical protein VTL71DRAFT_15848 [Oculimacula yallundae]|uniref:Uncharacterized protein n=1 Tax=Oculimacula yallundae TaxID=86028 RepID=A0ABR4CDK4_9HELO